MPYMPVDIVRLFDSDIFALSTGDEFKAAFTLWGKAFLQVPAGSLPDDDRILAHLTGTGNRWAKLRPMALRGWIKCSDGRLYHPVVTEKALEAWEGRMAMRSRTEAARAARAAKRREAETPTPPSTNGSAATYVTSSVTDNVTGSKRKGEGEGECKDREERSLTPLPPSGSDAGQATRDKRGRGGVEEAFSEFWEMWPKRTAGDDARVAFLAAVRRGLDAWDIVRGLEAAILLDLLDCREGCRFLPPAGTWIRTGRHKDWLEVPEHIRAEKLAGIVTERRH
jgi:hypothetical protein